MYALVEPELGKERRYLDGYGWVTFSEKLGKGGK
jgi:hypothetical protein